MPVIMDSDALPSLNVSVAALPFFFISNHIVQKICFRYASNLELEEILVTECLESG